MIRDWRDPQYVGQRELEFAIVGVFLDQVAVKSLALAHGVARIFQEGAEGLGGGGRNRRNGSHINLISKVR